MNALQEAGVQEAGVQVTGVQVTGMQVTGMQVTGVQVTGLQVAGLFVTVYVHVSRLLHGVCLYFGAVTCIAARVAGINTRSQLHFHCHSVYIGKAC